MTTATATPTPKQTVIRTPDADIVQRGYFDTLVEARTLKITTEVHHKRAQEILKEIATAVKVLHEGNLATGGEFEGFDDACEAANKAHKFLTNLRKMALAPYEEGRQAIEAEMNRYEAEEEAKRQARQKELDELARKQEEERRLNAAVAAEQAGDKDGANAILEEDVAPMSLTVASNTAKVEGVSKRWNYKAKVDDVIALLKFVVENPAFANLITPNQSALDALAKAQKDAFKLAGCSLDKQPVRSVKAG